MKKLMDKIFVREAHTCPWWLCFTFDNPVRGLIQNPFAILRGYVKSDDTVLDIGPGMGYFTFPLSEMVGVGGKVVALDIQEGMLKRLEQKVSKNKASNIKIKLYDGVTFNLNEKFDFILLFWMYHEVKNKPVFIKEISSVIKKDAKLLIVEPKIHVDKKRFDASIQLMTNEGFKVVEEEPRISLSHAVVLQKK
jgi:ubiquinone/menaquinone biosynthesis C-methylase UbiE